MAAALCAALLLGGASATPAHAGSHTDSSLCVNRLCTHFRDDAPSCWRFSDRKRVSRCFITRAAEHFRQPARDAVRIATRESRLDYNQTNSRSGAAGLFQFLQSTWRFTPYRHHDPHDPRWGSLGAMWMWSHGYRSHWNL